MNKPTKIAVEDRSPDYALDAYGWAMAQAALIREGRINEIDWENVAEEIESVGKTEYRTVESALRLVLLHLLKWEHQITHRSKSWRMSIRNHLLRFDEEMAENPSLKPRLDEILQRAYRSARVEAAIETGLDIDLFPETPPSWDSIRAVREL